MTEFVAEHPVVHLRGPSDLVEMIPFLLGFHPTDSMVVVELRQGWRRVGSVLRTDLGHAGEEGFVDALAARLVASGADGAAAVVYGPAEMPDGLPAAPLVDQIGSTLAAAGVPLCDALYVGAGRWWSYFCRDRRCCPAMGTPVADPGQPSVIAAAAAVAGLVALPDRQALERSLDPQTGPKAERLQRALRHAQAALVTAAETPGGASAWRSATRDRFRRAIRHARVGSRSDGPPTDWLSDRAVARLLVGLADIAARDACWRDLDLRCSTEAFAVCWQLASRSAPPYQAAPMFLLGWAAWRRGDGALARVAAHRALASDADYDAARLLLVVLDHGIDPDELPRLLAARPGRARPRGALR